MATGGMDLKKQITEKMQNFEERDSVKGVMDLFTQVLQTMYEDKETGVKFDTEDEDFKGYPKADTYMRGVLSKLEVPVPMSKEEITEENKLLKAKNE
jgi:hypothetical protein